MASRTGAAPRVLPRDHRLITQVWGISLNPLSVLSPASHASLRGIRCEDLGGYQGLRDTASGVEARVHHSAL